MLHYFSLALRRLKRQSRTSILTIGGLSLGIAAFLLILEYVSFEKSVNGFHKDIRKMYRLINEAPNGNMWPETEPGWASRAKERFPEIESYCRYDEGIAHGIVKNGFNNSEPFREGNIGYAEGNFFSFFSFPVVVGDASLFQQANTVFLNAPVAVKYFGKENPIGKTLTLYNQFGQTNYTVQGIYTIPVNSGIKFDMVFSLETLKNPANLNDNGWANLDNLSSQFINTCFKIRSDANISDIEKKLTALRAELKEDKDGVKFHLQAVSNMHLPASLSDRYPTTGNLKYVYILSAVAMLILLIAWFNYINLSTANAIRNAGEVGVRKVLGASRGRLILQFLVESSLVYLLSIAIALVLVGLTQPLFNLLVGRTLTLSSIISTPTWMIGLGLMIGGSLLAGLYTAYTLTGFNPVQTLKGKLTKSAKGAGFRKALVVSQFAISISLILVTVMIYQQLHFMQNSQLGLKPEQLIVVRGAEVGKDSTYSKRKRAYLDGLASQSFVQNYCQTGSVPGNFYNFVTSGFTQPKSVKGDELKTYSFAIIDSRYLTTFEIPLKAGRNFTEAETAVEWNDNNKIMMNESGIRQLGYANADEAVNKVIQWDERQLEIVGVVKDYNHMGLQRNIDPMIFYPQNNGTYVTIRVGTGDLASSVSRIESLYKQYFPGNPFEYFFEDENFNKQYQAEQQYGKIFSVASIWAILIACLGLFGLTTYSIETRKKEIGIRKVLGASVNSIMGLISKDFLKLVLIAAIIASPLAWLAISRWLQDFAYRIQIQWWLFLAVSAATGFIALLTIGVQTIRAALANPVKSIKSE